MTGQLSNSIAAINVADPSSPSRVGDIIDDTNLDGPVGIVYEASGDLLFVACNVGDALTVLSVADDAASPVVLGSVSSTSYMDVARYIASFPAAGLVFVTGFDSDSVCVVDVSDPSNPTVMEGLVDSTYMDGRCVVCSTDVSHKPHHNDPTKDPSGTTRGIVRNIG